MTTFEQLQARKVREQEVARFKASIPYDPELASFHYFYDWFCRDSSLESRAKRLFPKVEKIFKANLTGKKFDPSKVVVIFKNNCPLCGSLYDSIFIIDKETKETILHIVPNSGHDSNHGTASIYAKCGGINGLPQNINRVFKETFEEIYSGSWAGALEYLKTP